jgi:hypothetical protein
MLAAKVYFSSRLPQPDQAPEKKGKSASAAPAEEEWSEDLKLEHAIYTTALCSAVMGFFVWAIRDSLPPEGRTFVQVCQRAVVPVIGGVLVYAMASSSFMSREYEELKSALAVKFRRKAA